MNPASVDLKDMIVAAGLGVFGTTLYIGAMPDTPDLCIALFDVSGMSPELNYEWLNPAVQLQVRGSAGGYIVGWTKINDIAALLHGKQETRNGMIYKLIRQEGDIGHVTTDELRRPVWSTRFQIQRTSA
jgi:hypothetical protein